MQNQRKAPILIPLIAGFISLVVVAEPETSTSSAEIATDKTSAAEEEQPDSRILDAGPPLDSDAGPDDGGTPPPPPEELTPVVPEEVDESQFQDLESEKPLPFAKGDMEAGFGFALAGSGEEFWLGIGGSYAYYMANRFALGIDLSYTHVFSDKEYTVGTETYSYEYPDSLRFLPLVKFVLMRSRSVAPFLFVTGGYEVTWGTEYATDSWILGGGGGVHIGVGERFSINVLIYALHHWYNDTKVNGFPDDEYYDGSDKERYFCPTCGTPANPSIPEPPVDENGQEGFYLEDSEGNKYACDRSALDPPQCSSFKDDKDKDSEWFFPLITIGLGITF